MPALVSSATPRKVIDRTWLSHQCREADPVLREIGGFSLATRTQILLFWCVKQETGVRPRAKDRSILFLTTFPDDVSFLPPSSTYA